MKARIPRFVAYIFLVAAITALPTPVIMRWLGYLDDFSGVEIPVSFGLMFLFLGISAGAYLLASRAKDA